MAPIKPKVLCVGDCGLDIYTTNEVVVGGIAFNFAVHSSICGGNVALFTAVNCQEESRIKGVLCRYNVCSKYVQLSTYPSAIQYIQVNEDGTRKFLSYEPGCLTRTDVTPVLSAVNGIDVYFVPLSDGIEHMADAVLNSKVKGWKVLDLSIDYEHYHDGLLIEYLPICDIIFIGGTLDMLDEIRNKCADYQSLVILTVGVNGSFALYKDSIYHQPAQKIDVVDTTGCGDAFQAAFVMEYWRSRDIPKCMIYATSYAARVAKHVGGVQQ